MSNTRITVSREALLPALALAGKAVARRSTIPILGNLSITVAGGRMTLTGSDLDCEIVASLAAEGEASFTLPSQHLHDAVKKLPEKSEIGFAIEDNFATVISGRSRFRLPTLPQGDFPSISSGDFSHHFALSAEALQEMLTSVSFAVSTEETRYYLNGIHLHATEDHLVAVATDGHRLARYRFARPEGADGMPPIIVPRRTVDLMKQIVGDKGDVSFSVSGTKVRLEAPSGASLLSKLIDGTFPDYVRVIPASNGNRFTIERKALAAAIDRVTTISSERGGAVKFGFGNGEATLTLEASSPDNGSATDELTLQDVKGESVSIGFNGRYALDVLAATDCEAIDFVLGAAGDPAVVEPSADMERKPLFVLMPMRV